MKVTIEINCDGAAFEEAPEFEVRRAVTVAAQFAAEHIGEDVARRTVLDSNGNTFAKITVTEE